MRRRLLLAASLVCAVAAPAPASAAVRAPGAEPAAATRALVGAPQTLALYRGIPQRGNTLGNPRARVTLTEFADLQCPYCAQYSRRVLPTLVRRYVRTGRVKLVFRNLTFVGADSLRAARFAGAAGLQNRQWQFVDLFFRNQGTENSGYATDGFLTATARGAGVNVPRALRSRSSSAVTSQLLQANRLADVYRVTGVPAFVLARPGRAPQRLYPRSLTVGQFTAPIDAALRG